MERPIFRKPEIQEAFDEKGFVLLPFFEESQIRELQNFYQEIYEHQTPQGFHTLVNLDSLATRRAIYDKISSYYLPVLQEYLIDYRPFIGSFAVKEPGESSRIPLHLDWSVVDEEQHTSLNNWVPLVDTHPDNGCLCMLEGSHQFELTWRGSSINNIAARTPGSSIMQELVERYPVRPLCMPAGTGVIYSHRMAHFSTPNLSGERRIATSLVMIPQEAQPVHYHFNEDGSIQRSLSSTEFYLNYHPDKDFNDWLTPDQLIPASEIGRREDQVLALLDLDAKVREAIKA